MFHLILLIVSFLGIHFLGFANVSLVAIGTATFVGFEVITMILAKAIEHDWESQNSGDI